ncbi:MAG: glycosyltransferase family 9 protein [Planctomycetota bacterium]
MTRLFRPSPKRLDPDKVAFQRILVIRLDHIGDVVMATPLFRALKNRYPQAKLSVLVGSWAKIVVDNNPCVDEVIVFDCPWWSGIRAGSVSKGRWERLRAFWKDYQCLRDRLRSQHFDLALDPRGDFRHILLFMYWIGAKYRIGYGRTGGDYLLTTVVPWVPERHNVDKNTALLQPLGISDPGPTEVFCSPEDQQHVETLLATAGIFPGTKVAVLHTGARTVVKQWLPDRFAELARWLETDRQFRVILVGGKEEAGLAQSIADHVSSRVLNLAGKLSLRQLIALFQRSQLVVCNDSGPMHLAAAAQATMLGIFGPTEPEIYGYRSARANYLHHRLECCPCHFENACPYSDQRYSKCMREIDVARVANAVDGVLAIEREVKTS